MLVISISSSSIWLAQFFFVVSLFSVPDQERYHSMPVTRRRREAEKCAPNGRNGEQVSAMDEERASKKRCQANRRDADAKAAKAIKHKLTDEQQEAVRCRISSESGLTLHETVRLEIEKRPQVGSSRLGSRFWTPIFNEFGLNEVMKDVLVAPAEFGRHSKGLLSALVWLQHDNPAERNSEAFTGFMDTADPLPEHDHHLVLISIVPSAKVSKLHSAECFAALMYYWIRTELARDPHRISPSRQIPIQKLIRAKVF